MTTAIRSWMHRHPVRTRLAAFAVALVGFAGFGLAAVGTTGAYFVDVHDSNLGGTVGNIHVSLTGGGTNNAFSFDNLLPGEAQTATLKVTNTGSANEDIWMKFPNATALSALNNLGTYGEVHVTAAGKAIFDSANLNDRSATCGPFSPSGCWPLPNKLLLFQNLAPGHTVTVTFSFNYASKMTTQPAAGTAPAWNTYPVPAGQYSPSNPNGQTTVNAADGTGSGLPRQIVATQHGQSA